MEAATAKPRDQRETFWTKERLGLYSGAAVLIEVALIAIWAAACWVYHIRGAPPLGSDFRVYWSASYLSMHRGAAAVFNQSLLSAVESSIAPSHFGPWVYPPTFQLAIYPLALLPFPIAYAVFVCLSIIACLGICKSVSRPNSMPWLMVVAFPGLWVCVVYGQNSLLTLTLAMGALGLLDRRPLLAGMCAGMLVIKPQLAVVFAVLFLCGRHFRAFGAAALTATLLCGISTLAFGYQQWFRFAEAVSWFESAVFISNAGNLWNAMPTVLAIARRYGASPEFAYAAHAAVALCALIVTMRIWTKRPVSQLGNAALIVTSLLVQPYLVYYDIAWLLIPIICLCSDFKSRGVTLWHYALIALAWMAPFLSFVMVIELPNLPCGALVLPVLVGLLTTIAFRADALSRIHHHMPALLRNSPEDGRSHPGESAR